MKYSQYCCHIWRYIHTTTLKSRNIILLIVHRWFASFKYKLHFTLNSNLFEFLYLGWRVWKSLIFYLFFPWHVLPAFVFLYFNEIISYTHRALYDQITFTLKDSIEYFINNITKATAGRKSELLSKCK